MKRRIANLKQLSNTMLHCINQGMMIAVRTTIRKGDQTRMNLIKKMDNSKRKELLLLRKLREISSRMKPFKEKTNLKDLRITCQK